MKTKTIVILASILAICAGYFYVTGGLSTSTNNGGNTGVRRVPVGTHKVLAANTSKTDAYEQEAIENEEAIRKFAEDTAKRVEKVASSIKQVFASELERKKAAMKDKDPKEEKLVPRYGGRALGQEVPTDNGYSVNNSNYENTSILAEKGKQTEVQRGKPKIMSASIGGVEKKANWTKPVIKPTLRDSSAEAVYTLKSKRKVYTSNEPIETVTQTVAKGTHQVIEANIYGEQKVRAGAQVRFRLAKPATIGEVLYPRNTIVFGKAEFGQDRLFVTITRLPEPNGSYKRTNLVLHENDLMEGIYVPFDMTKEAGGQALANGGINVLAQALGPVGQIAQGAGQVLRVAATSNQSVNLRDGDAVKFLFVDEKKKQEEQVN
jgi:hypothetical protein